MKDTIRILIAEDLPTDADLAEREIKKAIAYPEFKRVETEEDFVEALENFQPHLIVSDYQMPAFNGMRALQITLEKTPLTPLIIHTGSMNEDTAVECMKAGATDYVIKEHIKRLGHAVTRALELKKIKADKEQTQQALVESEERFRRLAENAEDLIYRYEFIPEKHFSYVSPSALKITGYTPEEHYADPELGYKVIHPDDIHLLEELSSDSGSVDKPLTLRWIKKDGQIYWVEQRNVRIFDDNGNLIAIEGIARDITERIKAEETIRHNERLLQIAGNLAHLGGWSVNLEENLIAWSDQVAIIHEMPAGYSPTAEEAVNFYAPEYKDRIIEVFTACVEAGVPLDEEIQIITAKGRREWVRVIGEAIRNKSGKIIRVQGGFQHITQLKMAEKELQLAKERAEAGDRLKSAFMNNISHEIRTPLNGILGFGQMIVQSGLSETERSEYFKILQNSTNRLINTVTDYMDISLIVSENMTVNARMFSVNELLSSLHEVVKPECIEKDIALIVKVPEIPARLNIHTDPELLRKALQHLLSNAIKFTGKGSISFGCDIEGSKLEFFVSDTGIGIGKDALEKIFKAFVQEDMSISRNFEGSGLGLSIAKGIISMLGGEIAIESEKGKGTMVRFAIPHEGSAREQAKKTSTKPQSKENGNPLVLVAEDEISNFRYLEVLLKKSDIRVLHAKDGSEAVEFCKKHPDINLVLMDIKMPVMDGLEATKRIKEFRRDLPIIAVTAYAQTGDEFRIRNAGCDGYLAKPVRKELLLATIKKAL